MPGNIINSKRIKAYIGGKGGEMKSRKKKNRDYEIASVSKRCN